MQIKFVPMFTATLSGLLATGLLLVPPADSAAAEGTELGCWTQTLYDLPVAPEEAVAFASPDAAVGSLQQRADADAERRSPSRTSEEQAQIEARSREFGRLRSDGSQDTSEGALRIWRGFSDDGQQLTAEAYVIEPYGAARGWAVRASRVRLPEGVCQALEQRQAERLRLGDQPQPASGQTPEDGS